MKFKYHDLNLNRVAIAKDFGEGLNEEQKKTAWGQEDVIIIPEVPPTVEES